MIGRLEQNPLLRSAVSGYTLALMTQFARTAACNRLHSVRQRCARWLLMSRDRVGSGSFPLTHEGLALLLGARRASISEVAEDLRRNGVIEYRRGLVTILDADCLEEAACEDYAFIRDAYDQVQPPD